MTHEYDIISLLATLVSQDFYGIKSCFRLKGFQSSNEMREQSFALLELNKG